MEQYPADITIGGELHADLVEEFIERCREDRAGPDWDGGFPDDVTTAEDLLKMCNSEGHLVLMNCQACYGQFRALEEFLEANKMSFDAHNDSHHDGSEAYYSKYRPELPNRVHVESNNQGHELMPLAPVLKAAEALDAGNIHAAQAMLDDALGHVRGLPVLPKLQIVNYSSIHHVRTGGSVGGGQAGPHSR